MDDAISHRDLYGAKTDLMDWDAYIEGLGPEPGVPDEDVLKATAERVVVRDQAKWPTS